MNVSYLNVDLRRRSLRASAIVVTLTAGVLAAKGQTPAPPYALFQYASITASGNTVTATEIPVIIAPGITVYENLTLQFNVDASGNITIAQGFPQFIPAPQILSAGFKTGTYAGPGAILGGKALISVSGPGVTDGGATQWSLSSAAGADACTFPYSANWYVGPISNNPYAARINAAKITSTVWSYGVASASQCAGVNNAWYNNALIGVSQVGNTLTIASFSFGTNDYSTPQAQITYTMTQ